MRRVYIQNFGLLNKVGVRATMDAKLVEQRSVIKFLLKNLATFFKGCKKVFLKHSYPIKPFIAGFHSLGRAGQARETSLGQ